jgi:hypothetical protein
MLTYYAGIGSRETPDKVLRLMERIGHRGAERGYVLRSGGASGADQAFEFGCVAGNGPKEIYMPWRGFSRRNPQGDDYHYGASIIAYEMAARFHPNWAACTDGARTLHARNCHQVLGMDLNTPCTRIICWTPNGARGGGTGQALRIAQHYDIEIHDLGLSAILASYKNMLEH